MGIYIIAITGASGAPYARQLSRRILDKGHQIKMVISDAGRTVLKVEESVDLTGNNHLDTKSLITWFGSKNNSESFELINYRDVSASIASGSFIHDGMVIIPCSGGTLGRIANGISLSLIDRAAHVAFKERRKLICVHRETPIGLIDLENMKKITEAGGIIMPASPGFYHNPKNIEDLITFIVDRILDHLLPNNEINNRWTGIDSNKIIEDKMDV